ncbi:DAP2 Dipeptidyl aminopeptidase B [Candida maltosa Xu316]|uniref:Dipeptidyl aminopeptidase B n=1 Tax=Candida maltosa (strain Xu316) TaxID=1245528 RepID=M3J3M8_CANMX|nr:hypothetical protein G210_3245 [Candida maltosa Xu316]
MKGITYDEESSEKTVKRRPSDRTLRTFKRFFYYGTLLSILIYGTSFLLITIDRFSISRKYPEFESLSVVSSKEDLPEYASPSTRSTDFKGKIPFSKEVYDEHVLEPKLHSIQWIKTPESVHNDQGTYVIKEESADGDDFKIVVKSIADDSYEKVLIKHSRFKHKGDEHEIIDYIASPDLSHVLLKTDVTSLWRHSSVAHYWVLNVDKHHIEPLYDDKLSTVAWSHDGEKIAFIYNNNLYYKSLISKEIIQVTTDGSAELFNGKPDWVYEEEVYGSDSVFWWSPDSKKLAFLRSNNTEVPEFVIPFYAQPKHEDYPEIVKIKYPKAGYPNPIVDILTFDLDKKVVHTHNLKSKKIDRQNRLITEVVWIGESLKVKTSNRHSDLLETFLIDKNEKSTLIRTETAHNSWFEASSNTVFIPANSTLGRKYDGYLDIVVEDGFNHLAYFASAESSDYELLTKGNWEVTGKPVFDYTTNTVYFTSTIKSPIERHVHSINLLDRSNNGLPYIKDITTKEGWYSSSFSSGARFLFLSDLGPGVPTQRVNDLKLHKDVQTIEDNQELVEKLRDYVIPEVKYSQVELTDEDGDTFLASAVETLPLNFDKKKKYPVLFYIYGGPGSQTVTKKWGVSFSSLIAAELDAIVVTVDGRGTGFNNLNYKLGSKFKFIVRDRLGKYEPLDVIAAANKWAEKSYVDPERIAVWGWSYGGFLTLKTLETDIESPIFNYGVSIAPVTHWRLYDSIYTERYLNTPQENPEGYETGSIHNVTNFKHVKKFFIGHGSGDDNVHVQNSLQLLDQFNLAEIENFEFMIFPDSNHGMNYHNGQKVVYDRILSFFRRAFDWEFV